MQTGAWTSYLVAIVATVVALVVRLSLSPLLGEELPYITFFGAVMTAAWFGGLGPGLLATGLTLAMTGVTFVWPHLPLLVAGAAALPFVAWRARLAGDSRLLGFLLCVAVGLLANAAVLGDYGNFNSPRTFGAELSLAF